MLAVAANQSAPLLHRTTAGHPANELPRRLWLCWRALSLLPLFVSLLALISRCDRLPLRDFLAIVVVIDAETGAAGDLDARVAIGPEAAVTDQRADASRLGLDRIERIETCEHGV